MALYTEITKYVIFHLFCTSIF